MTPESLESLFQDFRNWLTTQSEWSLAEPVESSDMAGLSPLELSEHLTAIRHELKLLTQTNRGLNERVQDGLSQLSAAVTESRSSQSKESGEVAADSSEEQWRAALKLLLDLGDSLETAGKAVHTLRERFRRELAVESSTLEFPAFPALPSRDAPVSTWLGRRLGIDPQGTQSALRELDSAWRNWAEQLRLAWEQRRAADRQLVELARQWVESLAAGYTMSLQRIERLLPQLGLERIACLATPFDPETMEVIAVELDSDRPPEEVVEVLRHGYRRGGRLFRLAQVRVAGR
ncbi:nucleotide exchange factor GrpE [Tuwongella immobilis]|uniref:Protein GrpE n=1 Tax=Tuwongella immobilis TaxID=692036 RepID=A0A6C2YNE5_9BACT|nr:nucleotide exchange factor GrpE [Tuwongella immobilis]VIP02956.1 co-chaperone : Molecular chaperone GrpE (Heat shock protein) OS=Singulisphaera acidiphila (strain ATCC BAA-1392 / DSM 18658 / VKM B-2454 / MOB10) GN=Sinac_0135 PE=3 SV=1: GrpE [Tuwongella immobilis]VTS02956.1 co-chaperone : Molecular chaperone GrpE (Heat shock protein) OS=Singulisphaera acidiphila (strain ATCC BAA-1392 / DSM 18658 / VKM B-2454 / MOB10) GN=Sinac_0135 PE=3 SV=1: GrpE [Tuwongella immobilis]